MPAEPCTPRRLPTLAPGTPCPDCPATLAGVLRDVVAQRGRSCPLRCVRIAARQPLAPGWATGHGLALVRRGLVVRQRVDVNGSATAIDAVGPGGAIPLSDGDAGNAGYAASEALICLCPSGVLASAIDGGNPSARDVVGLLRAALDRVERISDARSRRTAVGRVAAALCTLADTLSSPRRLEVIPAALQQRDLAGLLAMRHESVCRVMRALERSGAVAKTTGGARIVDRAKLEAVA